MDLWKSTEYQLDIGMIFKKMYCHKCGTKLKKEKTSKILKKGDKEFSRHVAGMTAIGPGYNKVYTYYYVCPKCKNAITYEAQLKISKIQKQKSRNILNDDEIK